MKNFSPKDYIESVVRTEEELAYLASCLAFCKASPDLRQCLDLTESIDRALDEMYPDRPAPAPISFQVPKVSIDLPIVDKCNLGCECCSHYAPLAHDAKPVDMTDLAASLSALRERGQAAVNQVNILGGEPLLHEKLPEIVRLVHDCFPVARRFVVSNMLLFGLRKGKLLPAMKETDTWFGYSAYWCNGTAIQRAIKESEGVPMVQFGSSPAVFHKVLKSETPDFETSGKRTCGENSCLTLLGNRIYLCSSTPYLHYLNSAFGTNLHAGKFDYIELADVERSAEILLFSALPHPFCRHCNMKNAGRIVPGRSSRSRTEWLMDAKAGDSQCSG